jgi:hypothetical protein
MERRSSLLRVNQFMNFQCKFCSASRLATLGVCLLGLSWTRLNGQTLQMQVDPLQGGKGGRIVLNFTSAAGNQPVALQWEFSYPDSIALDVRGAKSEEAAVQAQKSVRCELLPNRQGKTQTSRCIVAGGSAPLTTGAIVSIKYSGSRTFRPGRYDLHIKKAIAVTADLRKIDIKDTQAEVNVAK